MIGEILVLFRIKHFKKSVRRVSLEICADLIHFIKQENRVIHSAVLDVGYDPSGDSSYICPSVSSDLSLVSYSAQRHSGEFSSCGSCYGFGYGSLSYSRRANQTDYRALYRLVKVNNGKIFQDPFLDFIHSVVILIKDLFSLTEVRVDLAGFLPRQSHYGLHVVSDNCCICRVGTHLGEFGYLPLHLFFVFFFQLQFVQFIHPAGGFCSRFLAESQFILDDLHLFVKEVFFLVLFYAVLHLFVKVQFQSEDLVLLRYYSVKYLEPFLNVKSFKYLLFLRYSDIHLSSDGVTEYLLIVDAGYQFICFSLDI